VRYTLAIAAPAAEPMTLAEAKTALGVHSSNATHDDLLTSLIGAARAWCENYTRRVFVPRALTMRMDCFPGVILLPRPPFVALSALEYVDGDGATQAVGASLYQVDAYASPARIALVHGATWPIPKIAELNAVTVTWQAGYAATVSPDADDLASGVPEAIKNAILLLTQHWYDPIAGAAAEQDAPRAVKALLAPYEVRDFRLE
jgi:uncharacterized phiE125 gp8 family phage protein